MLLTKCEIYMMRMFFKFHFQVRLLYTAEDFSHAYAYLNHHLISFPGEPQLLEL